MDEKISKLFLPLLDKLYNTEPAGEPFRKPVDVVKYGCFDYYLYVKHPIDLSTIREKLVERQYNDAWRFVADIQLMFSNAYLFNKRGTPVYEYTNKLYKIWNAELTPVMQRLNYCCGNLHKFGPQLLFCHGTTPDKYCQIPIGAKYKCYQDQYSFCVPCFNKIETNDINIQGLSCETTRMKLPTQPVKKSDFIDCTNDNWQYESFIQCTQCSRRVHQICDLYPANENEIEGCIQHAQLENEQKMLRQVPEEYRTPKSSETDSVVKIGEQHNLSTESQKTSSSSTISVVSVTKTTTSTMTTSNTFNTEPSQDQENDRKVSISQRNINLEIAFPPTSLDDELLQFARDVDEDSQLTNSAPTSPTPDENKPRFDSAKEVCLKKSIQSRSTLSGDRPSRAVSNLPHTSSSNNAKNSVDNIAARLSINKLSAETHTDELNKQIVVSKQNHLKFTCNHCYRKKKISFDLRHRKYSARRLPHTRMSRYIETKVNEHIRENTPAAGEVTIRVLTAYRDTVDVNPEMREYVKKCRQMGKPQHPFLKDYPDEFSYTNRAIFAWQEIDGVDVCVFGMHVQEYGEDCPEPNRQVVYLSYLDSVHFFRPKQVRTAVYHEILLSYFKYVKKLGFRRVFIWVCPSRKGDDYIFYRHPTEQKMPTLKRLSDWYINLLDKGIMAGIVEKHHNIYQYANSQNWNSILSLPYLSGDYWPGEFERLLKIMIESQKEYEAKLLQQDRRDINSPRQLDSSDLGEGTSSANNCDYNGVMIDPATERHNMLSLSSVYQKRPPKASRGKMLNLRTPSIQTQTVQSDSFCYGPEGDFNSSTSYDEESKLYNSSTPDSSRSDFEQPLDLSKNSFNASPNYYLDDDGLSETSFQTAPSGSRKRRRKSNTMGYTKKRGRPPTQVPSNTRGRLSQASNSSLIDGSSNQPLRLLKQRSSTQTNRDSIGSETLLDPGEELMRNLAKSLKRQREGFIVARLNECDCSPHFESQRRKEETFFTCDLMKGREPFLQLARLKNYEFSTLRRAKFSSLAMVKHLGEIFKLEPICNECYSFDSSKRHYACPICEDFYLCTSCQENTHHEHIMSLTAPLNLPDIDEFLQQCSLASTTNSISSASSTISNKSFNESNLESVPSQPITPTMKKNTTTTSTPLNNHLSNTTQGISMPLSCQRQKNYGYGPTDFRARAENEENSVICPFGSSPKPYQPTPPPSHSANNTREPSNVHIELDHVLVENFMRHAEVSYDIDFEQMKGESKKLLSHYWNCPMKETCHMCKFVVLSCSFMSVLMRSSRMQMMINCNFSEILPSNTSCNNNHPGGINLTTAHRLSYQPKDK